MPTTASPPRRRAPRFRREGDAPRLQITERDIAILRAARRYRFLRSDHIAKLIGGSLDKILERLTILYRAQYLDRPEQQLDYYRAGGGSSPMVYALGNKGAQTLIELDGLEDASVDWARKNKQATRPFIRHTLAVAEFSIGVAVATRARPDHGFIDTPQLIAQMPAATQTTSNPLAFRVQAQLNGPRVEIGVVPDDAFALMLPGYKRRPFVIERDRGTMPIMRKTLTQTSVLKKLIAYHAAHEQKLYERTFGWKALRVLIITDTLNRAANIRAAIAATPAIKTSPLFLIADASALETTDPLTHAWLDGAGHAHHLI